MTLNLLPILQNKTTDQEVETQIAAFFISLKHNLRDYQLRLVSQWRECLLFRFRTWRCIRRFWLRT